MRTTGGSMDETAPTSLWSTMMSTYGVRWPASSARSGCRSKPSRPPASSWDANAQMAACLVLDVLIARENGLMVQETLRTLRGVRPSSFSPAMGQSPCVSGP